MSILDDLRVKAGSLGIPVSKTMNTQTLQKLIDNYEGNNAQKHVDRFDDITGDRPKPGYARVIIHKNPDPRAANTDWWGSVNGFAVQVRRGEEVDIPIKILRSSLMLTKMTILRDRGDDWAGSADRYYEDEVYDTPFTVLMITEGQDPKHYHYENNQKKKNSNRVEFHREHGFWPKPQMLREWVAAGKPKKDKDG